MSDPKAGAEHVVIAVDPGRSKCGVAVVRGSGEVMFRAVVATAELAARIRELSQQHAGAEVIIGNGTNSGPTIRALQTALGGLAVTPVEERGTSILARQRYLDANPPRGWRRLIPRGLRTPNAPYDDYVAVILAERRLAAHSGSGP